MVPLDPGPWHNVAPLGYARLLAFHICLLFPHFVKFLANTMQFNTTCKDYDSINQHSHQSTRTTGPQGGQGANHDYAQGGEERGWSTYKYLHIVYMNVLGPWLWLAVTMELHFASLPCMASNKKLGTSNLGRTEAKHTLALSDESNQHDMI